ncbi:ABC-three component system protein [Alicyclobacillus kakegawensis]|uniref:ABC-three component system protein n=1 Tax=Alicyclobacillus kakegawensis TaxID=392012 RepID=UPI00082AF8F6|nr:ABC-three component system protein [Alicyclobacillus kakegawensis]
MIHRIFSSRTTFKELTFHPGLNLLITEKSPGATSRQTRNGAGKSSLVEIIHFLLGSNCDKQSIFRNDALIHDYYGMDFDLRGSRTQVSRSGQRPSDIYVTTDNHTLWPRESGVSKNELKFSNSDWKSILGLLVFNLPINNDNVKFGPSFRSLVTYFARRQSANGFSTPEKHSTIQQLWDTQVSISYLLGLDWTIPQQWQVVRQKEGALKELRKIAADGELHHVIGTVADLRTKLTLAEERVRRLRENIETFNILPEYRELENEANELTQKLANYSNLNTVDRELIDELERSIQNEPIPPVDSLERLYREVGVIFPDVAKKRIEDARVFHQSVVSNRRSYLQGEIDAAKQRIAERNAEMERFTKRRADIMKVLSSHGALEHFMDLQSHLVKMEAEVESIRQRFIAAEQLEGQKTELEIERRKLLVRLQQDYQEESSVLRDAIVTFQEISNALYENAGSLSIVETSNGPQFEVKIQGGKSKGINNMQIFCFDMMLMKICSARAIGPGFLIHDSHLFDGVDDRQIATALSIGARLADECGFQYIVTMNSDDLPKEFPPGFDLLDYELPLRLTDASDDGGLFGIRF